MIVDSTQKFPIKMWTDGVPVEESAMDQLRNVASLPFIHKHIAVMPDVHWGKGSTVGSVIATKGAIIPAAVGVDIGCGMIAQRTTLTASDLPDNLFALRTAIESRIPHGRTNDGGVGDRGAWSDSYPSVDRSAENDRNLIRHLAYLFDEIVPKHTVIGRAANRAEHHAGTLGTGNHFIEICLDLGNRVWIMLHSGSRGIGNRIGTYFIDLAKKDMRRWFVNLPDQDLAYIPEGSDLFSDYVQALNWAQKFAVINRNIMMDSAIAALGSCIHKQFSCDKEAINCHHNYVSFERHFGENVMVTRKGAVSAKKDELGIIPGSMGAKSFIVRGKGNRDSFESCSHGAGRKMSRKEAKKVFTLDDHIRATQGVECRKDSDVIDETPGAYKDIDLVMSAQSDLVSIEHILKQVLCVKG